MERSQVEQITVGAGPVAGVRAVATGRLPRWLRIVSVVGIVAIAGGVGLFAYRTYSAPTTLTIAVGSLDADANKIMSAIATRMASANAPVRLKVLDKGTAPEAAAAFSAGQADLAVVRADTRNIPEARTVVLVTHAVALLIALPGSSIDDMGDLKGKTVGVVGSAVNQNVVAALTKEYDLDRAKVNFRDIPLQDLPQAIKARQMQALLVVAPISEKYLGLLRGLWPRHAKLALVAIEFGRRHRRRQSGV